MQQAKQVLQLLIFQRLHVVDNGAQVVVTDTAAAAVQLKEAVLSPQMVHPMCVQTFQTCTSLITDQYYRQVMDDAGPAQTRGQNLASSELLLLPQFDSGHGFGGNASLVPVRSIKDVFNICAIHGGTYVTLVVRWGYLHVLT